MNTMLSTVPTDLAPLFEFVSLTVQWFDHASFGALVLVAFVLRVVVQLLPRRETAAPPVCSGIFLLAYFLHRYLLDADHLQRLVHSVVRCLLASHIVWSVIYVTVLPLQWLQFRLDRWRWSTRWSQSQFLARIRKAYQCIRRWWNGPKLLPLPPATPPPPSRAVVLRRQAEAARADYEAEVAALVGLPLDEDEREMLLNQAKQRLLHKLNTTDQIS